MSWEYEPKPSRRMHQVLLQFLTLVGLHSVVFESHFTYKSGSRAGYGNNLYVVLLKKVPRGSCSMNTSVVMLESLVPMTCKNMTHGGLITWTM